MKKLLLASIALAAFAAVGSAGAADMPVKAPPPVLLPSWAGFYIGGEIGGSWLRDKQSETTALVPPLTGNATTVVNGLVGGGYAGYNWQVGRVVFGPEIDFEGTTLHSNTGCLVQDFNAGNVAPGTCFPPTYSYDASLPWQGSIRGRIGYTWTDVLLYVTGGFALAEINTSYASIAGYTPGVQSFSQTKGGGTVGAGLEYKLDGHWIGRMEYRYTDFGTVSNAITTGGGFWNGYTDRHSVTQNTVRIGVSYLFQGPITAKY